MMTRNILNSYT